MVRSIAFSLLILPFGVAAQFQADGPDAPEVGISWSDGYMISLADPAASNNVGQDYQEYIPSLDGQPDPFWRFQGYLVFQVVPDFTPVLDDCFDPDIARLVAGSDVADGLVSFSGARHLRVQDDQGNVVLDTCYVEQVEASDSGLEFTYVIQVNAFTGEPFLAEETVCFVVFAYATNPYNVDTACAMMDGVLLSRKAAYGSIQRHCVNAVTAGISEQGIGHFTMGPVPATDDLLLSGTDRIISLRVADAMGQEVFSMAPVPSDPHIRVATWPAGWYALTVVSAGGHRTTRSFLVAH